MGRILSSPFLFERNMKNNKPKIFDYVDHVKYMNDMVEFMKKEIKAFSFRYFAKKSGFASQSALKFFLDGKRNLTIDSIQRVCKGFSLDTTESKYFESLVRLNQETSNEKKNQYFHEMLKIQKKKKIKLISSDQYEYFSNWYNPAIRELIRCKDFQGDPKWIAKRIFPMISVIEARESLRLLERLGLIRKNENGDYIQVERAVTTERELLSMSARNFHREMGHRAVESLDSVPIDRRDFSGITFGLPASKVQKLKDKINEFREELNSTLGSLEEETDDVYHLNIQLFPLTKKDRK
jgi:uncharacterized protein (TIGR02147 family)